MAYLLIAMAAISLSQDASPVDLWSVFPGDGEVAAGGRNVHDPTVVEIGGRAFCFSTSGNSFTTLRTSRDLKTWTELGPILKEQPEWLAKRYSHRSIWAPDVVILGDRVRVYYAASNFGTNTSVLGLAECAHFDPAHPQEGWVDKGLVLETKFGDDTNAIDAEVVVDDSGRQWMYYGSYWAGIYVCELDPQTGKLKVPGATDKVCVAKNTGERGNPLEGPAVLRKDSYYYLFVSYGLAAQGVRSTYRIMVGRSKTPTGPFLDHNGKSMAEGGYLNVLKTSPPMMSPGHCDVLRLKDGRYVMPYHYYDARRAWHGDNWGLPTLQIRELLWSKDGWPLPGLPIEMTPPRGGVEPTGTWTHQADFGQPMDIELKPGGVIAGGRTPGTWKREGGELVLTWARDREPGEPFVDRVQLAYGGSYYVGRNGAGAVIRGVRTSRRGP